MESFRWFCDENIVLGASCLLLCGFDPGSRALRCCRHNFIVAVPEYLSFADIENLFYAVVGEITSTSPSTGEFGSIAIARITDAFRRLRYTISEGFLVMC